MNERVPGISAALQANGGADGYLTFTDNVGMYPGAKGWLTSDTAEPQYFIITELKSNTQIGVRFIPVDKDDPKLRSGDVEFPYFGKSDCSAYTTGDNARIDLPAQVVPVYQPLFDPLQNLDV